MSQNQKPNPKSQHCASCVHFVAPGGNVTEGYCKSIKDTVFSWFTGCIRHEPRTP